MRVPRFPMPRLYLGPVAWVFVMSALSIVYFVVLIVWAEVAIVYYGAKAVWQGIRWTFFKLTGRTL